jgi:hypothetical protein
MNDAATLVFAHELCSPRQSDAIYSFLARLLRPRTAILRIDAVTDLNIDLEPHAKQAKESLERLAAERPIQDRWLLRLFQREPRTSPLAIQLDPRDEGDFATFLEFLRFSIDAEMIDETGEVILSSADSGQVLVVKLLDDELETLRRKSEELGLHFETCFVPLGT